MTLGWFVPASGFYTSKRYFTTWFSDKRLRGNGFRLGVSLVKDFAPVKDWTLPVPCLFISIILCSLSSPCSKSTVSPCPPANTLPSVSTGNCRQYETHQATYCYPPFNWYSFRISIYVFFFAIFIISQP